MIKSIFKKRSTWILEINNSKEVLSSILFLCIVLGIFLAYKSSNGLNQSLAFGKHTLSLIYPLSFSLLYIFISSYLGKFNKYRAIEAILLFLLVCLPLIPYINNTITHISWDDGYRNSIYANNIIDTKTLWGSDEILWGEREAHKGEIVFIDQPGYRYWLALAISIFRGETRGMQVSNLLFVLVITLLFIIAVKDKIGKINTSKLTLFLALCSPYFSKNVLQGLTEWLTLVIFLLFIIFFLVNLPLFAIITLGLMPFIRQNLLIFCFALMFLMIIHFRKRFLVVPFLLTIGLPLYHNLFFAGKFQLLVSSLDWAKSSEKYSGILPSSILGVIFRSLEYLGYEGSTNSLALILAWLFVPFSTLLIIHEISKVKGLRLYLLLLLTSSLIVPTLLYGSAYYPRFVFINQSLLLISILIFSNKSLLVLKTNYDQK